MIERWHSEDDGDTVAFTEYLEELLETGELNLKQSPQGLQSKSSRGPQSLSPKQIAVAERFIPNWDMTEIYCSECHQPMPWTEVSFANDNDGQCS